MLANLKSYLEKIHITPISWIAGVAGVLMVRFFLESLSNPTSSGFFASDASTLVHYGMFFFAIAVIFMIVIQISIPKWKHITPQLIAVSFFAVLIAPIIDWAVSGGRGLKMVYLFDTPKRILLSFLSFTNESSGGGSTIGLQIEIGLVLLTLGLLVYFVGKSWKRAVVSILVLYTVIFSFASLPGILSLIGQGGHPIQEPLIFLQKSIANSSTITNNLHSSLEYSSVVRLFEIAFNFIMGKVLFFILLTASFMWFRLNFREKFKAMFKNSRPERVAHYMIMIAAGLLSAYSIFPAVKFNWNDWLSVIVLCLSFYFSIMFAVCVNDAADEDVDAVSNTGRPLITKSLSKEDMKQASVLFLATSLVSGFLAGYTAFFFVLAFTALYYIYSAPPTRFKLIPFFSSFIIGLCCLTGVLAGFFLLSPLKYVSVFPARLALAVVVVFFLGSHIRDMKDIEGDKKAGIKTVPVLLGDVWGPKVVGFFAALAFLLVPVFSGAYILFAPAIPAALAVYYFVNRKPYAEKYVFRTYFTFVLAGLLLLLV